MREMTPSRGNLGDEALRKAAREAREQVDSVASQERFVLEAIRARRHNENNQEAIRRLYKAALVQTSEHEAVEYMNRLLEQFEMKGAVVPVETSIQAVQALGEDASKETKRFVSWKRVMREQTEKERKESSDSSKLFEIPIRIQKILRVQLRNAPWEELIAATRNAWVHPNVTPLKFPLDISAGVQEILLPTGEKEGEYLYNEHAQTWLEANELDSVGLKQLLMISEQFPEEQMQSSLIGFGQKGVQDEAERTSGEVRFPELGRSYRGPSLVQHEQSTWLASADRFPATRRNK